MEQSKLYQIGLFVKQCSNVPFYVLSLYVRFAQHTATQTSSNRTTQAQSLDTWGRIYRDSFERVFFFYPTLANPHLPKGH